MNPPLQRGSAVGRNNQRALRRMVFIRCNALRLLQPTMTIKEEGLREFSHTADASAELIENAASNDEFPHSNELRYQAQ